MIKNFFYTFQEKGTNDALNDIFNTNQWLMQASNSQIDTIKNSFNTTLQQLGNYCGYEIVSVKNVGTSLVIYACLAKFERQPLRLTFTFYKANDNWALYNFSYDSNLQNELEELSKFSYLN
jgi:hypothetical protein